MDEIKIKNPNGRPTKYDPDYNTIAYKLCLLGATDVELANFFEVTEQTICNWKREHPGFFESLKNGKQVADAKVAERLYQRALGYEHPETVTASFQGKITDTMEVTKHYPPDTTAAIKWLTNRQPAKWRDTQNIEVSGLNGQPIQMQSLNSLPLEDLLKLEEIMAKGLLTGEVIDIEESK